MCWIIFMTVAPIFYSLIYAAPQNEVLPEAKPENGQYTITMTNAENMEYFVYTSPSKEQRIAEQSSINSSESNSSTVEALQTEIYPQKTNFSTLEALQSETDSHSTLHGGSSEKESPTVREDAVTIQTEPGATGTSQQAPEQPSPQTVTEQQTTASEKPSEPVELTAEATTTKIPTTKRPKPSKPKPARATTVKPLDAESPVTPAVTVKPTFATVKPTSVTVKPTKPSSTQRYPCRCGDGTCSCCTGIVLENFNVPLRSRACANVTYEPDDFAFNFKLAYNNIVLYNRRMSAKNPRPACIPINRYFGIKMCAKLSNVYMSGRNMHACLDFEGFFDDETAFKYSFNCFRIGSQGVAIVRPEEGGGLPPPPDEEEEEEEEYDDSA